MKEVCVPRSPPAGLATLLAVATGLVAANIYYVQPLAGPIGAAIGMPPGAAGLIVTLTRLNGLYMATFFAGGAIGSTIGAWAFTQGGWPLASAIGFMMPIPALSVIWRAERSDQLAQ